MTYSGILVFLVLAYMSNLNGVLCNFKYTPVITLPQGKLRGFEETTTDGKSIYSFKGIPYAHPPIGPLRFEEPVKHVRWSDVLEATQNSNPCVQHDTYNIQNIPTPFGSEDCLYLNVFTPKPNSHYGRSAIGHKYPVMVYIHGGAWISGSAAEYPPYVLLNEDIVLVVIQYRLGAFGFLSTEDPSMPGNIGLKDQRLALQWVQENIGQFGGDPGKVTIFGESAGAASVHLHMLSPGSAGLFEGAIAQSGTALCPWAVGKKHRTYAAQLGTLVNCMLGENSDDFKTCLKNIGDAHGLYLASLSLFKWGIAPFVFSPRIDGNFLPEEPVKLLKEGRYHKVNFINGVNRDEGAFFIAQLLLQPAWIQSLGGDFDTNGPFSLLVQDEPNAKALAETIYGHYLEGQTLASYPINELVKMITDIYFNVGSDYADFLHAQDDQMKLYLYELDYKGQNSVTALFPLPAGFQFVSHADDLFYLFSGGPRFGLFPPLPQRDLEVRNIITKMWTNFAKYGNPTPKDSFNFEWSPTTSYSYGHLNITQTPTMMGYSRYQALQFWFTLKTHLNQMLLSGIQRPKI